MAVKSAGYRQWRWSEKQQAFGNCRVCGRPRSERSSRLCERHRLIKNATQQAARLQA